jgi:hypothetical protein
MKRLLWLLTLLALILVSSLVPHGSATSSFAATTHGVLAKGKVCHYKVVVKKVNGKKKHVAVKVCHAAKPKPTATPEPTDTPLPLSITGINIYAGGITSGCQSNGAPASIFPASIPALFIDVHTLNWIGPHEAKIQIQAPNGSVYATIGPDTFSDSSGYCGLIPIASNGIANQGGTWNVFVYLDGAQAGSTTFTLTAVTPTPTPGPHLGAVNVLTAPAPSGSAAYTTYHHGVFDGVVYVGRDAIAGLDCGGTQCGYQVSPNNSYGTRAGDGLMYVWIYVQEQAGQYASTFNASFLDFQLRGDDGSIYQPGLDPPPVPRGLQVFMGGQVAEGDKVGGWISFKIPARPGQYALRWTSTPFIQVITLFTVSP